MCCTTRVAKAARSLLVAGLLIGGVVANADYIPSNTQANIELDGNMVVNNAGNSIDWLCFDGSSYGGTNCLPALEPYAWVRIKDNDAFGSGKDVTNFAKGGSKDQELIGDWEWKAPQKGSAVDKDDIINATVAIYGAPNNDGGAGYDHVSAG